MNCSPLRVMSITAALSVGLAASNYVHAQDGGLSLARLQLPAYCKYTPGERNRQGPVPLDPAELRRWEQRLAPVFLHLHHYCWGLGQTNEAMFTRDPQQRTHLLSVSIKEFDYVLGVTPPDFVLLPEILTKKGENLIKLDQAYLGVRELERAIAVKPDYWPPYAALSDYYKKTGETGKARNWLEKGLAVTPDIKALKSRLADLNKPRGTGKSVPQSAANPPAVEPKPPPDRIPW